MKSILASLVSFFLAATFSDSASCFHVSAAEVHTPNSAITVNGITVRAEEPDARGYNATTEKWPWDDEDTDDIKCATIYGLGKSMEVIAGECRVFAATGDPGERGCEAALDEDDEGWITPEEGRRCIKLYQIEPANWTGIFYADCPK